MELMGIVFVVFILGIALGMVLFLGGDAGTKKAHSTIPECPSGFHPSLAYMEKFGENGIAYDEAKKLLCLLHQGSLQSQVVSPADVLAVAILEDGAVLEQSLRTDKEGKTLLANFLTDEINAMFTKTPEASATPTECRIKPTSQSINLRILINDPDNPLQIINFLNMETKKGGLIYHEASRHAKNWQDLLSFLIRQAGKTPPQTHDQATEPAAPIPAGAGQPS